ncbi:MAG TPA: serine protease [Mycobacteriales bacterium]|nr:serine protease [Mycobacteriales bacterium]
MRLRAALVVVAASLATVLTQTGQASAGDGLGGPTPSIVGGTNATQTYSFMASLQSTSGAHRCGASLISSTWLVTAAHCVSGISPSGYQLRVGSVNRTTGGTLVRASRFVMHPNYDPWFTGRGDMALIQVASAVPQAPISISSTSPAAGTPSRILGWGQTCPTRGCGGAPTTLKQLDTSIITDSSCSSRVPFSSSTELCVNVPSGQGACYGDSGGPALVGTTTSWRLVGATSRGTSSTCGATPTIYTDVTAYRSWITSTTGIPV